MSADTVTSVTDLRAFEHDLLYAVRTLERNNENPPKGLTIKHHLETQYPEEINHSRLYQNLDSLTDHNLLQKGKRDDRTNEYTTTDHTRSLLEAHAERRANAVGLNGGDSQ